MKKNLRSLTALVLTFCMVFALSACVGSPVKNDSNDNGGEKKSKQDPGVIKIDNCEAVYKGFEIKKDSDDENALVVKWDFTNNGDEEESFG